MLVSKRFRVRRGKGREIRAVKGKRERNEGELGAMD